jgi:hypothetical protein
LLFRACRPRYGWLVSVTASSLRDGRLITTISLPSPQRRESWWFSRGGGCTTTTRPKKPSPIDRPSSVRHARTPVSDVTSVRFFPGFPLVLRTTLFPGPSLSTHSAASCARREGKENGGYASRTRTRAAKLRPFFCMDSSLIFRYQLEVVNIV